ncbi:MAG: chemotaxis protein CheB [Deltaproteobacteria bacterium]|nr:chemotaxis protein CheB [Nannocystaceae bacterium]
MGDPGQLIVIGGSAGALEALAVFLPRLPADYPIPMALLIHLPPDRPSLLASVLASQCRLAVREVEDKEQPAAATLHVAVPNYHLLVERRGCFSLSVDDAVNFSRPSIDVLFESAADAYGDALICVLLGGANHDGALGLAHVAARGGTTLVQSPASARAPTMPEAALRMTTPTHVLTPAGIGDFLLGLVPPPLEER